jgi:hypothetical protein
MDRNHFEVVRWRYFLSPDKWNKPGLRGHAKLADDAHEPVL